MSFGSSYGQKKVWYVKGLRGLNEKLQTEKDDVYGEK